MVREHHANCTVRNLEDIEWIRVVSSMRRYMMGHATPARLKASMAQKATNTHVPRSFDVEKDEHPVQWLSENWDDSMAAPLSCWLDSILEHPFCPDIGTRLMPAPRNNLAFFLPDVLHFQVPDISQQLFSLYIRVAVHTTLLHLSTKETADVQALAGSCLLLAVDKPSEGWPLLTDWLRTAGNVWQLDYEAHRAPIEVRPLEDTLGLEMKLASLVPTKGVGRATVILFGICYTYCKMRDMDFPELEDFTRQVSSSKGYIYDLGRLYGILSSHLQKVMVWVGPSPSRPSSTSDQGSLGDVVWGILGSNCLHMATFQESIAI